MFAFLRRLFRRKPKEPDYPPCFIHDSAFTEVNLTTGEEKKLCRGMAFGWDCRNCDRFIVFNFWKQSLARPPAKEEEVKQFGKALADTLSKLRKIEKKEEKR